jgi:SAM-dependent methyltransferase
VNYDKYKKRGDVHWKWYLGTNTTYRCLVDESIKYFNEGTVLDIGCGDGLVSYLLALKGMRVIGIDSDETGLNIAKERLKYMKFEPVLSKVEDFKGEAEYLYSLNTIEHLDNPNVIVDLMKKSKFGVIITDNGELKKSHPYHQTEFIKESLKDLFHEFKTEFIEFSNEFVNKHFIGIKIYNEA